MEFQPLKVFKVFTQQVTYQVRHSAQHPEGAIRHTNLNVTQDTFPRSNQFLLMGRGKMFKIKNGKKGLS